MMRSETMTSTPFLKWQDDNGISHKRNLTGKIFIGRYCRGIDEDKCIIVRNHMVSRDHAVIRLTNDGVEITDMSKNGTWINDVRMAAGASRRIEDGDTITVGDMSICLVCPHTKIQADEDTGAEQTTAIPMLVYVTSLVADIRGFSGFSQKSDSEIVYVYLKEIFSRFSGIVNEHQGTIKDYAGDAVFAFWEHPRTFSADHARRACQAAISQLHSVPEICRKLKGKGLEIPPPILGWGVTTGHVTLSHFGARAADIALVGDCINLAFRLSSMANKTLSSPIVLCRQTASLVKTSLPLVELGDHEIRGRMGKEALFGLKPV
jgi:adenylate cyclase